VRPGISRQRHEHNVASARFGDAAARDDAAVVAVEYDLEQHLGVIGRSPRRIVVIAMLEDGQVELLLNDLVERKFERPLDDLVGVRQWNHLGLIQVVVFVSGHGALQ
jgi:hypothetical protein